VDITGIDAELYFDEPIDQRAARDHSAWGDAVGSPTAEHGEVLSLDTGTAGTLAATHRLSSMGVDAGRELAGERIRDRTQIGKRASEFARAGSTEVLLPSRLDLANYWNAQFDQLAACGSDGDQAGSGVVRILDPLDVARALELIDDRPDGLFAQLRGRGEIHQAGPGRADPLEHSRLVQRKVVSMGLQTGQHGRLQVTVGNEQQRVLRVRLGEHPKFKARCGQASG
jgi:hypothetical protein